MFSKKQKLLKKINPKVLQLTPKLTAESGSIIDLDSDLTTLDDGAKKLRLRFFKNCNVSEQKNQNKVTNSLCAEFEGREESYDGAAKNMENTSIHERGHDIDKDKPGRKWQKLKNELLRKISDKWEEEYKKRIEGSNLSLLKCGVDKKSRGRVKEQEEKHILQSSSDSSCSNIKCDIQNVGEDISSSDMSGSDIDDELKEVLEADSEEEKIELLESTHTNDNIDVTEDFDNDNCSLVPAYQPGGGLLFGGSELTQNDNSLPQNLFSPSLTLDITQSFDCKSVGGSNEKDELFYESGKSKTSVTEKNKLFQNSNDSFDLDDALEFCSGKFPDSQVLKSKSNSKNELNLFNQEKENSQLDVENRSEELLKISIRTGEERNKCVKTNLKYDSEKFDLNLCDLDSPIKLDKMRKNIIQEESEPEDISESQVIEASEESENPIEKLLSDDEETHSYSRYPKKKVVKNLCFSDDDGSSEKEGSLKDDSTTNSANESGNETDDEQKSVNYDSEENELVNPKVYFEKEAELSGSEDWSDDEDEREMDEYEIEEGDADNLDSDQVKSQLEKIHIRQVLDDDIREVRFIQEILFEDGDLYSDGKGRDRKFKWKNLGTFEDKENEDDKNDKIGGSSSDEDFAEEEMRKVRHQKTLFLLEKKKKKHDDFSDDIVDQNLPLVKVTSLKNSTRDFVNVRDKTENSDCGLTSESQKPLYMLSTRGSFLKRNEEFLSKLAKVTSSLTDNVLGPKHSKNFVFTSKSPKKIEEDLSFKRQHEDTDSLKQQEKRIKIMSKKSDTEPSILELFM